MRVFDLPADGAASGKPQRIVVTGSCRVLDPFEDLAASGTLVKVWANYAVAPHTFGEVDQILRYTRQERDISEPLIPFVFAQPHSLRPRTSTERRLLDSADVFVIEISDLLQIRCGDTYFQSNAFWRSFNARFGTAVLPWYRALSLGQPVTESLIESVMGSLSHIGGDDRDLLARILRDTCFERVDVRRAEELIDQLRFNPSAKWLFVSHFMVPGLGGPLMEERRKLSATLQKAATARGAAMFDPSNLVAEYGADIALGLNGADISHYNPVFQAAVAEALLSVVDGSDDTSLRPGRVQNPAASLPERKRSELNRLLSALHQQRLAELGEEASGLYAHYRNLLQSGDLVGLRAARAAELITRHLPAFDRYDVPRAGLGETALLLSALGKRTNAFEGNGHRLAAIEAGAAHLRDQGLLADGLFSCRQSPPPTAERNGANRDRCMVVATQLVLNGSEEERSAALATFECYDAVLCDPASLLPSDGTTDPTESTLARLKAHGFSIVREYPAIRLAYCARPTDRTAPIAVPARPDTTVAEASVEALQATFNELLLCCHRERLARLGPAASGLYAHYAGLVERGTIVDPGHAEIARRVGEVMPRFARCHVLRAGLGEVAFLLAGLGNATLACEPNRNRLAALRDGLSFLRERGIALASDFEAIEAVVPEVRSADTLAVATELVFTLTLEKEQEIMSQLAGYGAILLDRINFLQVRGTEEEQEAALELLRRHGFSSIHRFPSSRLVYAAKS